MRKGNKGEEQLKTEKSRRRWLWKAPLIVVGSLVGLILLAMTVCPLIFTSGRLTRWVNEHGTEYLVDGEVRAGKVELSVWSTFPYIGLKISDLQVINNCEDLPGEYREVMTAESLSGRLNPYALLGGNVSISKVEVVRPQVTLWMESDEINSLSILPPDDGEMPDLSNVKLKDLSISGDGCLRYISPMTGTDVILTVHNAVLRKTSGNSAYAIDFSGSIAEPDDAGDSVALRAQGNFCWNPERPMKATLSDFCVNIGSFAMEVSTDFDFTDVPEIYSLDLNIKPLSLQGVSETLLLSGMLPEITGTASAGLEVKLLQPYSLADDAPLYPAAHMALHVTDGSLSIPDLDIDVDSIGLDMDADISPDGLDSSTVSLKRLYVKSPTSDFTLSAQATNLESDAELSGTLRGVVDMARVSPELWEMFGLQLHGQLDSDCSFKLNVNDLSTFELDGKAELKTVGQ